MDEKTDTLTRGEVEELALECLGAAFANMLVRLEKLGWALPWRFCMLGQSGAVIAGHVAQVDHDPILTVEYVPDGALTMPINILWTDATGQETQTAVVAERGVTFH